MDDRRSIVQLDVLGELLEAEFDWNYDAFRQAMTDFRLRQKLVGSESHLTLLTPAKAARTL